MANLVQHISARSTPQAEPIPGKIMVPNSAGGFTFALDKWKRLERFLILGSQGGTYYATERKLTIENAKCVTECLDEDPARAVAIIVDISVKGRAPKNDPAILALAIASAHDKGKHFAWPAIVNVCRTGTHLFQYVAAINELRGWGSGQRKAVARWYSAKDDQKLALQVAKYQQRDGWSHKDVLRLAHPTDKAHNAIYRWVLGADPKSERHITNKVNGVEKSRSYEPASDIPLFLQAVDEAKTCDTERLCKLIIEHKLPRECIPTEKLNDVKVWSALFRDMPMTAMLRNLGKMTSIGLLEPLGSLTSIADQRLTSKDVLKDSRVHPMAILIALKIYAQGHGDKGSLTWKPVPQIVSALALAFYLAFDNVVPTGKRTLIGCDVSGSMTAQMGGTVLTCREAVAAMAMVTARTEREYHVLGFTDDLVDLGITASDDLLSAMQKAHRADFGRTDCSLPMRWALQRKAAVDSFLVLTDNETFAGSIHPSQALQMYRREMGIPAKLCVQAFRSTGFTIADPDDAGMMDVVGLDTATPAIVADFFRE